MAMVEEAAQLAGVDTRDRLQPARDILCVPRSAEITVLFEFLSPPERKRAYQDLLAVAERLQEEIDRGMATDGRSEAHVAEFSEILQRWEQVAEPRTWRNLPDDVTAWLEDRLGGA